MAKDLAKEIGYIYIDSGAMYRAVTLYSIENGIFHGDTIDTDELKRRIGDIHISFRIDPETGRPNTYLNGVNVENKIRTMEVSSKVSPISALGFVREAMVAQQQEMGKAKGIVMDGRDIGTTVFPDAELKIFVTASAEIRAQRRYDELKAKGQETGFEEILENVKQRDHIDHQPYRQRGQVHGKCPKPGKIAVEQLPERMQHRFHIGGGLAHQVAARHDEAHDAVNQERCAGQPQQPGDDSQQGGYHWCVLLTAAWWRSVPSRLPRRYRRLSRLPPSCCRS